MSESKLRFVKVDYQEIREALIARIKSRWPLLWNDYLNGNFGIVLVDIIAWAISTLSYTVNRLAGENFVGTMQLRESAVRIGRLVGYKLKGALPAVVLAEASVPEAATADITISAGTLVRSSDATSLPFEVDRDYVIYAGTTTPDTTIVAISPSLSGDGAIQTGLSVEAGGINLDLLDPSADLTGIVSAGMTFSPDDDPSTRYRIGGISSSPGATGMNRIVLAEPWEGATSIVTGRVFETRIALVQGQTVSDRFELGDVLQPNYSAVLSRFSVIDRSVVVRVNNVLWNEVDRLATAAADADVFEVATEQGVTTVYFGDGVKGSILPIDAVVAISYRIGGGSVGNLSPGKVDSNVIGKVVAPNQPVSVRLYNATPGVGGQDQETLEEARVNIPNFARTQDRAVTAADYVALALAFSDPREGRIKYARTAVRVQNSLLEGNVVVLYCWAQGEGGVLSPLTSNLKAALRDYLQLRSVGTDFVVISDGTSRPLPVALRVRCQVGFSPDDTIPLVQARITKILSSTIPGESIIFSDMVNQLSEVPGVDSIQIATPSGDVSPITVSEVFTPPSEDFLYPVLLSSRSGAGNNYTGFSTVTPLTPWSMRCFVDGREVTVVPDLDPNYAMLIGEGLNEVRTGRLADRPAASTVADSYFFATDQSTGGVLYQSVSGVWVQKLNTEATRSRIDLRTGLVTLSAKSAISSFEISLIPVAGYQKERKVDIYVGCSGVDLGSDKRNEIRTAVRRYFDGLRPGGTVYGKALGLSYDASVSNLSDVIANISGVTAVNRVALGTVTNPSSRVDATDNELLRPGTIVVNNDIG